LEDNEKEELNPLQIFLLVLVKFGLSTPYTLMSKAGLGPGMTSPTLKRLKEAGLLTSTPGPRNRLRYAMTEKGANQLTDCIRLRNTNIWQFGEMDIFESLPRGIILTWLHYGVDEANQGAESAAYKLAHLADMREGEAEVLYKSVLHLQGEIVKDGPVTANGVLIAMAYQWIKAECDAALFRRQIEAIGHIRHLLAKMPPAPQIPLDKGL